MPRDYKYHASRKRKKSLPGYAWLLSGLAIGLFIAFISFNRDLLILVRSMIQLSDFLINPCLGS